MTHLDSSLLIDLLRETTRERPGEAFDVMESLGDDETLAVSVHVVCELRAGAELARRPARDEKREGLRAGPRVARAAILTTRSPGALA